MKSYKFETWDVFTNNRFAGNPLAIVMDADGLTSEQMQVITNEFNLSETTFVLPPKNLSHTARVRIFTPGYEMPFAGHPTVGTAIAIARARGLSGAIVLELNAGDFVVSVNAEDKAGSAEFLNPNLPQPAGEAPKAELLEAALSLPAGALDRDAHCPRLIGAGGVNFVYCCAAIKDVEAAGVNSAAFAELDIDGTVGVYLYAKGGVTKDAAYHARMFAPNAGIVEDPATGSAAASLPGQLALAEALSDGEHRWLIEQGFEMGRPSLIRARVEVRNNAIVQVRIGGEAVTVQKGELLA